MPKITGEDATTIEGGAPVELEPIQGTEEAQSTSQQSYGWIQEIRNKLDSQDKKIGAHELIIIVLATIVSASVFLVVADLVKDRSGYERCDGLKDSVNSIEKKQNTIVNCLRYRKVWQYEECLDNL